MSSSDDGRCLATMRSCSAPVTPSNRRDAISRTCPRNCPLTLVLLSSSPSLVCRAQTRAVVSEQAARGLGRAQGLLDLKRRQDLRCLIGPLLKACRSGVGSLEIQMVCLSTARGRFSPRVRFYNNLMSTDVLLTHSSTLDVKVQNNLIRADYLPRHAPFFHTTNSTVAVLVNASISSIAVMYCWLENPAGKRVTLNETRFASAGPGSLSFGTPLRWPHNKLQAQQRRTAISLVFCEHRK
jgi:hypothetical protein